MHAAFEKIPQKLKLLWSLKNTLENFHPQQSFERKSMNNFNFYRAVKKSKKI